VNTLRAPGLRSVVRRTAAPLGAAMLISQVNSIVILLALTRIGTRGMLADYRLALSAVAIASIVALPGAATAVGRSAAGGHAVAVALARQRLPWALFGAIGLTVTGVYLSATGRASTGLAILAAALVFVPWAVTDLAGAYLIGAREFSRYLRLQIVVQCATAVWVAVALLVVPGAAWPLVAGYLGLTAAAQGVVLLRLPNRPSAAARQECYTYGKRLSRINVLSAIDLQLDVLLTAALLSRPDVALLAVARTGGQFVKALWYLVAQANIGRLAALEESRSRAESMRLGVWLTAGFAVVCGGAAALCPTVVPLVFGHDYAGAVRVAQLLLLVPAVGGIGSALELHLKAQARVRELYVLHIVKPLTSCVCLPLAILKWGLLGVGIEALAIAALYSLLTGWLVVRPRRSRELAPAAVPRGLGVGR